MGSSKPKTVYVAETSIRHFFLRNPDRVWFWTFSEPGRKEGEALWTKDEAEARFKPFKDLCARRGVELLTVWERQKRGSWHPHCLVNRYIDVVKLRPWMIERGWGQQMRVEHVRSTTAFVPGRGWVSEGQVGRLAHYLIKYLRKGFGGQGAIASSLQLSSAVIEATKKKKVFSASRFVKRGNTRFDWNPWDSHAGHYLYLNGVGFFIQMEHRKPDFRDIGLVLEYGAQETDWATFDPWWRFGFP